ncbi:hypothetical protein K7432_003450 [Basidiobolus ranarum]|uniref:Enkurin domain-containing protein n=1 Tax=Basidiobolus ranarum TaxID=34480 RepID=A0ABR2W636_9FUNG
MMANLGPKSKTEQKRPAWLLAVENRKLASQDSDEDPAHTSLKFLSYLNSSESEDDGPVLPRHNALNFRQGLATKKSSPSKLPVPSKRSTDSPVNRSKLDDHQILVAAVAKESAKDSATSKVTNVMNHGGKPVLPVQRNSFSTDSSVDELNNSEEEAKFNISQRSSPATFGLPGAQEERTHTTPRERNNKVVSTSSTIKKSSQPVNSTPRSTTSIRKPVESTPTPSRTTKRRTQPQISIDVSAKPDGRTNTSTTTTTVPKTPTYGKMVPPATNTSARNRTVSMSAAPLKTPVSTRKPPTPTAISKERASPTAVRSSNTTKRTSGLPSGSSSVSIQLLKEEIAKYKNEIEAYKNQLMDADNREQEMLQAIESANQRAHEDSESFRQHYEDSQSDLQTTVDTLKRDLKKAQEDNSEKEELIESLQAKKKEFSKKISELKDENEQLDQERASIRKSLTDSRLKEERTLEDNSLLQSKLTTMTKRYECSETESAHLRAQLMKYQTEEQSELGYLQRRLRDLELENERLQDRIQFLTNSRNEAPPSSVTGSLNNFDQQSYHAGRSRTLSFYNNDSYCSGSVRSSSPPPVTPGISKYHTAPYSAYSEPATYYPESERSYADDRSNNWGERNSIHGENPISPYHQDSRRHTHNTPSKNNSLVDVSCLYTENESDLDLDERLKSLTDAKDQINFELARIPSSGNAIVRRRKNQLEEKLDEIEGLLRGVKMKIKARK